MKKKAPSAPPAVCRRARECYFRNILVKPVQDKTFSVADMQKIDQLF